jgi:hypothetical protein
MRYFRSCRVYLSSSLDAWPAGHAEPRTNTVREPLLFLGQAHRVDLASQSPSGEVSAERPYIARATGVAAAWLIGAAPAAFGLVRCPSAQLFHFACPGCGLTRASLRLLHGDVRGSLALHPLAIPILAATALVALATVVATWTRGNPAALLEHRAGRLVLWAWAAVHAASVLVWALRLAGCFGGPVPV